ncbi:MAG: TraR/DksA family transcriptional regulator [Mariniblastus sp.]
MSRKKSLNQMHDVLVQRRDALRQAISGDDSFLRNFSQQSGGDVVDFASDSAAGEISSQLAEVENRELKKVEAALTKFKEGTFGKCDACNGSIPLARLQALPYAAYCITCKRAAEKAGVEPSNVADWAAILDTDLPSSDMDFNFS